MSGEDIVMSSDLLYQTCVSEIIDNKIENANAANVVEASNNTNATNTINATNATNAHDNSKVDSCDGLREVIIKSSDKKLINTENNTENQLGVLKNTQKIVPKIIKLPPIQMIDTKELKKYRTLTEFEKKSLADRLKEFEYLKEKYPNKIPILVSKTQRSRLNQLDLQKYLINGDLTAGSLLYVIRKRLKLQPEKAIFMFVNGHIPSSSEQISKIYQMYKSSDGFLRVEYCEENVFG